MKRSAPLRRSTPLARTPMPRGRSALPVQSARRKAQAPARRRLVRDLLAEFPVCQIQWGPGCTRQATDVDELLGRGVGGSHLDPANCQTACRWCHTQKTENPAEAVRRGFTIQRRAA